MVRLAGLCQQNSVAILVAAAAISVLCATQLPLGYDDDVIRFLPEGHPEVERLVAMADRFGSIHVALVGVETDELFDADALAYVRRLHEALEGIPVVEHVTSLTELAVIESDGQGGSNHIEVVPHPVPQDAAALASLRTTVLGLDYLVGSLVSEDATSTRLVLQLKVEHEGERVSTKVAAEQVREVAAQVETPAGVRLHFGGAPFIAEAAANGSQRDLKRLAPWVCLIIVLLIVASLGSIAAAFLTLGTVGIGILWTMGLMGFLGEPLTLVSTSLPVILVALGSAYAVHLLVWYLDHDDGIEGMLTSVGTPVVVAASTTVAGFLSFLVMDLAPMRAFGWQMAAGTGICALASLLLIPAVLSRWPLVGRKTTRFSEWIDDGLVLAAETSRRHRWSVLIVLGVVGAFFGSYLSKVETRMDTQSFFEVGSEPERADVFMEKQFGGAVFLQVLIDGDIKDPSVLRQMADFEDRVRQVDGVTRIESITLVLGLVNEAVGEGRRHVARNREGVAQHGYLARHSDPAVNLLVDPDWTGALIQVAIGGFDTEVVRRVTADIRRLARERLPGGVAVFPRSPALAPLVRRDAAERIRIVSGTEASVEQIQAALSASAPTGELASGRAFLPVLELEILEEEMLLVKEGADLKALSAQIGKLVAGGTLSADTLHPLLEGIADAEELEDPKGFARGVRYMLDQISSAADSIMVDPVMKAVQALIPQTGGEIEGGGRPFVPRASARVKARVAAIVHDVTGPTWHVPGDRAPEGAEVLPMTAEVSGYPVVQEAMTQSVHANQINSLLASLPFVFLIMVLVFRSFVAGLIGMVPTGLTLLVTFGLMGLFPERLPLDIGSSMLASIALGVGIDYAIHFLWRYRISGLEGAMRNTGRAIVINAAEITAGFVVLVGASIVPMSNFGLLTAETLLVAAVATLVLMPAMVDQWKCRN